jgi:DNA polymerase-3 subunit gamma/tau
MNQQVLARKWRPTTFDQLIGQEHVRKALTHALNTGRLHHAYLFTGTLWRMPELPSHFG